jgi:endo-1,4-beta-xylanase
MTKLAFGIRARARACLCLALCAVAATGCEGALDDDPEIDVSDTGAVVGPFLDAGNGGGGAPGPWVGPSVDAATGNVSTLDASDPRGVPDARGDWDAGSAPDARGAGPGDGGVIAPPRDAGQGTPEAGRPPPPSGKYVGNITTRGQVRSDFAAMWNQITPENEGKWQSVEGTRNAMNWAGLDRVHDYARQHGLIFKQHTMVWGSQQPTWLQGLAAAQQRAEVEEWIRLFCERYPDVDQIDVVNEPPPHTTPAYLQALGGTGASGYDWIVQAFKWTRQYCPNATLILNDYNTIEYSADNTRFINIVKAIKAAGAPIDAVGAQAHDAFKLPTDTVKMFIDKLASETGLPVYISEYDLDLADDARQQQVMQSQITMFWSHPAVRGITLWGYVVGATWRPNTGLMSSSGAPRPALSWLLDFLER